MASLGRTLTTIYRFALHRQRAFLRGILVRTTADPLLMLPTVRRQIAAIDSGVPLTDTGSVESYFQQSTYAGPQFSLIMIGATAGVVREGLHLFKELSGSTTRQVLLATARRKCSAGGPSLGRLASPCISGFPAAGLVQPTQDYLES